MGGREGGGGQVKFYPTKREGVSFSQTEGGGGSKKFPLFERGGGGECGKCFTLTTIFF